MSIDEMCGVVRDLAALGCREFTMLGGEFLLRPDWYEIAKAVKEVGMELQLITNGLLVTDAIRAKFKTLDPQTVCVSLDGATPESYKAARGVDGFSKCRALLDELVADGFRQVSAITTFNAKNLKDFDAFADMFRGTEIVWQVQMAHKGGERFPDELLMTREQYAQFVEKATYWLYDRFGELKLMVMDDFGYFPLTPKLRFLCQRWDGCPAGRRVIGIRANGDVLPCLSLEASTWKRTCAGAR
jgi:MoaA/NifB/PqqE/SkfB family radical SAM enzyme